MKFDIHDRPEYFAQLTADVAATGAGDRVIVATMSFDSRQSAIQKLTAELQAASRRGVDVTFLIDAYTFLVGNHKLMGPLWYRRDLNGKLSGQYQSHNTALQRLESSGVTAIVTNKPAHRFLPPPKGRSHIKGAVINNKCYIGGCNLTSPDQIDIMASLTDKAAADWLYGKLRSMAEAGSSQVGFGGIDSEHKLNRTSRLILDSGKPRQSAILEAAYQLIDEAEDYLLFTCQFFPGGATAKRLLAAHRRGVNVQLYFSHPSVHQLEAPIHRLYALRQRLRLPKPFFEDRLPKGHAKLHAKVLLSEKAAMLGSHNYVPQGVTLGTAELAMHSTDASFVRDLRERTLDLLS